MNNMLNKTHMKKQHQHSNTSWIYVPDRDKIWDMAYSWKKAVIHGESWFCMMVQYWNILELFMAKHG